MHSEPAKRSPWSWWYLLFLVQFVAVLWPPFYNKAEPSWIGLPFFYWYQLLWVSSAPSSRRSSTSSPQKKAANKNNRGNVVQEVNWIALTIFVLLFGFITWLGFAAAHWRKGDLDQLHEWGLGGRRFGTLVTWFLVGGDLYTAYTFIAVPALAFGAGAVAFFAVPYTIVDLSDPVPGVSRASGTSATSTATSPRAISCAAASAIAGWRWRSRSPASSRPCPTSPCSWSASRS